MADKVPAELWAEIFVQCLPQNLNNVDMLSCFDSRDPPLVLTVVCRKWRSIALSTPMLWTVIYYMMVSARGGVGFSEYHKRLQLKQVSTWLNRSGQCPLRVRVGPLRWGPISLPTPEPAIQLLTSNSHRWKEAHLFLPVGGQYVSHTYSSVQGNLPLLRTLHLELDDSMSALGPADSSVSFLEAAPLLRNVYLRGSYLVRPVTIDLPWSQLSVYSTGSWPSCHGCPNTLQGCFDTLGRCTNVEDYTLIYRYSGENPAELTPITHTKLHALSILNDIEIHEDPEESPLGIMLDHLTAPSLEQLSIFTNRQWPRTQFLSFLSRHSQITKLTLRCDFLSDVVLIEILKTTPGLTHLSLGEEYIPSFLSGSPRATITQSLVSELAVYTESGGLLPALKSLNLDGGGFDGVAFLAMVESRWQQRLKGVGFQSTVVWLNHFWPHSLVFDESAIARLRELKGNGLNIRIFEGRELDTSQDVVI